MHFLLDQRSDDLSFFSHHPLLHGHRRHILLSTTFLSHLRGCISPNSAPFLPHSNKNAYEKFFCRPGGCTCTPWLCLWMSLPFCTPNCFWIRPSFCAMDPRSFKKEVALLQHFAYKSLVYARNYTKLKHLHRPCKHIKSCLLYTSPSPRDS